MRRAPVQLGAPSATLDGTTSTIAAEYAGAGPPAPAPGAGSARNSKILVAVIDILTGMLTGSLENQRDLLAHKV